MLTYKECRWRCMSKVRLTATIACFQIRKKWSKKPLVYRPCIFKFAPNSARNFLACKQQRRRSASAPTQFYQLSLESMIAKPATCKKIKNKIPVKTCVRGSRQFQRGGWGGGSNCFSREVRTSFSSRKQMATYDFHGDVRTPCPLCLCLGPNKHTGSEASAHIRVSNSLNSHFIYFIFLLGLVNSQNVC